MRLLLAATLAGLLSPMAIATAGAVEPAAEPAHLAHRSLLLDVAHAGDRLVAVGERGHVLLSDDGGANWRQSPVPTRSQLTAVTFADARHGWAVGHNAVILHSDDGGESWRLQHRDSQYDDPLLDVWFHSPAHGFAIGAYGLFLSTSNGGRSWDRRQITVDDFHLNAITRDPQGDLYIAGEQGHLYRSADRGYTWEELPSPYEGSFFGITALRDGSLLVMGLRGNLYRSADQGMNWEAVPVQSEASLMAASELADGRIVVVGLGGNLLTSDDRGRTFQVTVRKDRKALTAVTESGGELVLTGAGGAERVPVP